MTSLDTFFADPFGAPKDRKQAMLLEELNRLTEFHRARCEPYRRMLDAIPGQGRAANSIETLPYLPVRLFKMLRLSSVEESNVIRVLASSGTTSQQVSKIYLDRETALLQAKALVAIGRSFLGPRRLPMLIIDSKSAIGDRNSYSARAAGLLGFSNFGRDHLYLLDAEMNPDWAALDTFLDAHRGERIFLFGFTFMVWQYLYRRAKAEGRRIDVGDSILVHGGGWKKLQDEHVGSAQFRDSLRQQLGIRSVCNYYGMVEQVGSVYMECEAGHLHAPSFADVVIRDRETLAALPPGASGLIEVLSVLPRSYPGHVILTEDLGTVLGEDDCPCGRQGKYFSVDGRLPSVEIRGCSDTHAFALAG